jgi:hypothetical protein
MRNVTVCAIAMLTFACSSSPSSPCTGGVCVDGGSDGGARSDGGTAPAIDVRFRGIGNALSFDSRFEVGPSEDETTGPMVCTVGGISPGPGPLECLYVRPPGGTYTTYIINGAADCTDIISQVFARNLMVLSFGGACKLLAAGIPDGGPGTVNYYGTKAMSDLQSAAELKRTVVTAISAADGGYTYAAEGLADVQESYERSVVTAAPSDLSARATALASGGYVITASTWDGVQYTLVGTKPTGSMASYRAEVRTGVADADLNRTASDLLSAGYALMGLLVVANPDGGLDLYTLIAEK